MREKEAYKSTRGAVKCSLFASTSRPGLFFNIFRRQQYCSANQLNSMPPTMVGKLKGKCAIIRYNNNLISQRYDW